MNLLRVLLIGGLVAAIPARAVYAPLPEPEQQKDWIVTLRTGVMHDSNIFGSQTGAISSTIYQASPSISYNGSISDQTFASFDYTLSLDHFDNRPGKKTLDSHDLSARLAHAFSPTTNVDVSDTYQIARNPESLLAGIPVNTDQSFKRNEFDARFMTTPVPKFATTVKFRSIDFQYDNPVLSQSLDHTENLYGLAGSYDVVPELKAVGEVRHEDIDYRFGSATKNKRSNFVLGGFDYAVAKKLSLTARAGNEWRDRSGESSVSNPYVEISAKYDYAERSFLTAGYIYTYEETSNIDVYNDTRVNRLFVNVQHALSALIVASASVTYEPSQLQGRRGHPNADEMTTRAGLALTWLPTAHWSFSASYDYDKVVSDDPGRGQDRNRAGISAGYTF